MVFFDNFTFIEIFDFQLQLADVCIIVVFQFEEMELHFVEETLSVHEIQ